MKAFIQNLVQKGSVVSEKVWFEFLYVHDLGPRSRNDLDLQYSHTIMKSISCLYMSHCQNSSKFLSIAYFMKTADVIMFFFSSHDRTDHTC